MTKVPNSDIASVAEQATDGVGLVAVVDVKISPTTRVRCSADGTSSLLGGQQLFVGAKRNAVCRSQLMVFRQARVFFAPFLAGNARFVQVLTSPFIVACNHTQAAVHAVAVFCSARFEESIERFCFLTPRAAFLAGRKIERVSRHRNTYNSTFCQTQGAC